MRACVGRVGRGRRCGAEASNRLLGEWVAAWRSLLSCQHWDTLWVGLLGRLAKHDWKGERRPSSSWRLARARRVCRL